MNGTIKRVQADRGFGFVLADDGNEYFFHHSSCVDCRIEDLQQGQAVSFDKEQGPKGPRAGNLRRA